MQMSLIAGGSDHFVGSASGILLANLLQTCHTPSALLPETYRNTTIISGSLPPDHVPPLPSKAIGSKLMQAYCNHDHICYPYLSIEKLQQSFEAVYDKKSHCTASDEFFVSMALAIATAQVHKFNWNGIYDAETHYNRAMLKLADVMASGGIDRIQALLLVCQYRMGSTSKNTTANVWHLIGLAARMCLEMGLHRSTTYQLNNLVDTESPEFHSMQLKKKCFWSLIALDRVTSIALGRPLAIQLEDIDVTKPNMEAQRREIHLRDPTATSAFTVLDELAGEAIFAHVVSYRLLCGRILNTLYRNPETTTSDHGSFEQARILLSDELRAWDVDTGKLPLTQEEQTEADTIANSSCFRSPEWWKLLYHNAMLMLYRPSPCLCDASQSSTTLQRIFNSAQEAINLYASLHRSKKMNYSWITMHSVFNAGLSYIYALRNHLQSIQGSLPSDVSQARLDPKPTINQVFNDTRACSKVLVAVSERWDAAKNCSDLFDKLSDAVISDIVESSHVPTSDSYVSQPHSQHILQENNEVNNSQTQTVQVEGAYDHTANSNYFHVDSTFRDCFGDLQDLALDEYHNDALSRLSNEWYLELAGDV
jgi:hypothetical protein